MHGRVVFQCQGSDVCVGDEVGATAGYVQVWRQDCQVVVGWVQWRDVFVTEPLADEFSGCRGGQCRIDERGAGHQSYKSGGYHPRDTNGFISLQ